MNDLSEGACLVIAVLATTGTLRFFDLNEKLEAARHPLGLDNAGPLGFYGHPQHAGPAQSPPDQDSRAHHREVAPAPATSAKYTLPRNTSSGADHFRAVATMLRDVTVTPVAKYQNTSLQRKRFAAVQGPSCSPLMKKGSCPCTPGSSRLRPLGAFPCAIGRIACSDCATIARARSFLWIE